jgi:hypothetical protein
MNSVWIGFVGVIVGGLITTVWSLLAIVRTELADGMVAARLVDEDLAAREHGPRSPGENPGTAPKTSIWEHNRAALARVLGPQQWAAVSAAYRHPLPEGMLHDIGAARAALSRLVAGKRHVIGRRWRS